MTTNTGIYQDIATRTAGDIYIGVVGPVRAGKSTFIKRFMETQIIPNIDNVYRRERAKDELPQSGSGRTVMTSEPKFVPEEAVDIALDEGASCSVRLIDCVGYMVPGAAGQLDGDSPRMVTTPWADHPVTMAEAAELGTTRVIREHSTIGIVITTDGSITDIPREDYLEAEGRVIRELQEARAQGDLSENADYDAARDRQARVEARIRDLEAMIANAEIISEDKKAATKKTVSLGSTVTILDMSTNEEETYNIVGSIEADPLNGKLSNITPLATSLMDHKIGDVVEIETAEEPYQVKVIDLK